MICLQMGKTSHKVKPHQVNLRQPFQKKSTNQQSSSYKYKEFYHWPDLSQNTNI